MKNEAIYYVVQPKTEGSFWVNNIKIGIFEAARDKQCVPCMLDLSTPEMLPQLIRQPVLVVGNDDGWLESTSRQLTVWGAHSIIVNGSMQDTEENDCSGVVFELQKAIKDSVKHLEYTGCKRIALLGVNPHSVSDLSKCKAFANPESIIWAHGELEVCVLEFIAHFQQWGYDAVICANDTVAICLVQNMLKRKFRLPEDLFVLGMGNSYIGSTLPVPLTSIDFNYCQMGRAAVKLYAFLKENTNCGRVVSYLPCSLVIRASAPLKQLQDAPPSEVLLHTYGEYFGGTDAQNIVKVEAIMQSADETDRNIILGLLNGKSAEELAQTLFLSTRAVRYRITNLIKRYGFTEKTEFVRMLSSAFDLKGGA